MPRRNNRSRAAARARRARPAAALWAAIRFEDGRFACLGVFRTKDDAEECARRALTAIPQAPRGYSVGFAAETPAGRYVDDREYHAVLAIHTSDESTTYGVELFRESEDAEARVGEDAGEDLRRVALDGPHRVRPQTS